MMKTAYAILIGVVMTGLSGCEVRQPGTFETKVAVALKQNITVGGRSWTNPTADMPDVIMAGGEQFKHHCQTCHGYDGHATGVPFEAQLYPPIPDLGSADIQGYSDGQLKWVIQNGISPSGMPAWQHILDDNTMWKIVRYIRHLPPKGSLGAPDVYLEAAEAPQIAGKESTPTFRFSEMERRGAR